MGSEVADEANLGKKASPTEGHGMDILLSFGSGKDSHFLVASYVGNNLVNRGHNVTALVGELGYRYRAGDPHFANLTFQVYTHSLPPEEVEGLEDRAVDAMLELSGLRFLEVVHMINGHFFNECRAIMTDKDLLRRLESVEVIVLDPSLPCGLLIKSYIESKMKRQVRLVALIPYASPSFMLRDAGSPYNPAYRPDGLTGLAYPMTFSQRLLNFFFSVIITKPMELLFFAPYCDLASELGLAPIVRKGCHMAGTYDLYLFNSHFTTEIPYPTMPNVMNVGGLTVRPAQNLNKNYTDYLEQSGEHGVIVFTLGHIFATMATKKPEIARFFAEAFGRLPQRVLWQMPSELPFPLPPNIMTARWLPQNDLLE
ncbi:UDP-glucuronosyltransferase 2B17-like [Diadema antillarum]|uniref:UDP-glucuronosyltransferase 2B17-like n=1 Tax=Diadema antillarum TaxID=105358 RepID=UPI003A8A59B0